MERDDHLLFEGVAMEEPSGNVDQAILARARSRMRAPGGGTLPVSLRTWIHLALAAGLIIGFLILWPQNQPPLGPAETGAESARAPEEVLRDLRTELDQINEMSELIPPEKEIERKQIEEKIKFCLSTLSELEEKLLRFDQGSLEQGSLEDGQRKETRL